MILYRIYRHRIIDSTNEEAKRLIDRGETHGVVIIADEQTAGHGRNGRTWVTPPMSAIAMTLILQPSASAIPHLTQISLLGGLAVLEGIKRTTRLLPQLKWPNDVLIDRKKISGVLVESIFSGNQLEGVVVGMGVNVNAAPPPDLKLEYPATCLAGELGHEVDREKLIAAILESFSERYEQIGTSLLTDSWSACLAMKGEMVKVVGNTEILNGILVGVDADGALLIRLSNGEVKKILTGDVHLRGM